MTVEEIRERGEFLEDTAEGKTAFSFEGGLWRIVAELCSRLEDQTQATDRVGKAIMALQETLRQKVF